MIPIGTSDLRQIAGMLSGDGMFSADDLVNYGKTVIVKPGAATEEGRVMTGADVQRLLGPSFSVFPMAVGYGPSVDQALSVFGNEAVEDEITMLEKELDDMGGDEGVSGGDLPEDDRDIISGGGDSVGRRHEGPGLHRSVRLEAKYLKALAKFAKCQTLLDAGRGRLPVGKMLLNPLTPFTWVTHLSKNKRIQDRAKMCDRLHDRLRKIRTKMANKGIDVSRFPRIDDVRRSMVQEWHARQRPAGGASPQVVYVERQGPGYQRPGYQPVSQAYLRDQAELEREMADQMPGFSVGMDAFGAYGAISVQTGSWSGAGGFAYTMLSDGSVRIDAPASRAGRVVKPGAKGYAEILAERATIPGAEREAEQDEAEAGKQRLSDAKKLRMASDFDRQADALLKHSEQMIADAIDKDKEKEREENLAYEIDITGTTSIDLQNMAQQHHNNAMWAGLAAASLRGEAEKDKQRAWLLQKQSHGIKAEAAFEKSGFGAGDQSLASSIEVASMREYWDRIGEAVKEALDEGDDDPLEAADDLLRDLRAETTGWLGSSVEHDYFGVEGTEFEGQYGDDSGLLGDDEAGDDEGISADADILGDDAVGLTGGGRGRGSFPEDDDDLLTARMTVADVSEDDDILLGPDGGVDGEAGADATGADADILGASDADLEPAAKGDEEETSVSDDALMDSDDLDVLGVDAVGDAGEATIGLRRAVTPDGRIVFSEIQIGEDEAGAEFGVHRPISKGKQLELARRRRHLRHAIRRAIRHGASDARVRALEHQLAMTHRQLRAASPTRGVDWSRVRPHRGGRRFGVDAKDPVVVIAIRKRPTAGETAAMGRDATIREITATVGYNPSDTHILDVAAARLVAHGYTPVEAMSAMRQATVPGDWVRGSRAAFPAGDDAPMVGPRRVGREVNG